MSFYRVFRVISKDKCFFQVQNRLASTKSGKSMSLAGRLSFLGGTMATMGVGTIAYASHNPNFKQAVDEYIPGFKPFVNTSADVFCHGMEVVKSGWNMLKPIIIPDKGNTGIQSPKKKAEVNNNNNSSTKEQPSLPRQTVGEKNTKDMVAMVTVDEKESNVVEEKTEEKLVEQKGQEGEVKQGDITVSTEERLATKESPSIEEPKVIIQEPEAVKAPEPSKEPVIIQKPELSQEPPVEPVSDLSQDYSSLEARRTSVENELRSLYNNFMKESDNVITAIENVAESMKAHFSKIKNSTESPPDNEMEIETVAECIGTTQKSMDDACKTADECKATQDEVSKRLSAVVAEALNLGILEELVEQICDKALEYQRKFESVNNNVKQTEDDHKSWQDEIEQQMNEKKEEEDAVNSELLPLADLDAQQEMLLLVLRKKIENMEEEEKKRLMDALDKQQEQLQKEFDATLENERRLFEDQFVKKEHELDTFYEEKLKNQLYHQADAYSCHLAESLQTQASDLHVQFESEFSKKLFEKEHEYRSSLTAAMARLKGIQSMINTVTEAGKSTRKQQNVRTASDSLTSAFITANSDSDPYSKHVINKEITSLKESASDDPFIQLVLSSVPKRALEEGIASKAGLIKRFGKVKRICKRVALVGEEGGGLGSHLLSFIQSLLMFDMIYDKIVPEDHEASMNTLKLLSCAGKHIEKGDLETAVRLVNQLSGEARRVAEDWVKEACLYLETRQAVMVISEYLAASSYTVVQ